MRKIFALTIAFSIAFQLSAQSTDPLKYSGELYVRSYELLSAMRYVSFEDHGILTSHMEFPPKEVSTIIFDFENNVITNESGETRKIKVLQTKKYTKDYGGWNVVVYIDFLDDDRQYELVWQEYGDPYFLIISKMSEGKMSVVRVNLSSEANCLPIMPVL